MPVQAENEHENEHENELVNSTNQFARYHLSSTTYD